MADVASVKQENDKFDDIDPLTRGRGDCIALLDIAVDKYQGKTQDKAIEGILEDVNNNTDILSKYVALFVPTVTYSMVDTAKDTFSNKTFPASFHYLACAARSSENYNE
jgi:hypothetical protein